MEIRNAEEGDAAQMEALATQEGESYWSESDFAGMPDNPNTIVIVAEDTDGICGYITGFIVPTKRNEAMVHETRVDVNFRGQKIGTALVEEFCSQAFSKGAEVVYALIEERHRTFYMDSCGFSQTGSWIEAAKRK